MQFTHAKHIELFMMHFSMCITYKISSKIKLHIAGRLVEAHSQLIVFFEMSQNKKFAVVLFPIEKRYSVVPYGLKKMENNSFVDGLAVRLKMQLRLSKIPNLFLHRIGNDF